MSERRVALERLGLAFVVLFGTIQIGALCIGASRAAEGARATEAQALVTTLAWLALGAFACFVRPWPGFRCSARMLLATAGFYLCALVLWQLFTTLLWPLVLDWLGKHVEVQSHLRYFTEPHALSLGFLVTLATVCVIGPIGEEIFFRGYLGRALELVLGRRLGFALTAILFGAMHGDPWRAPPLVLLGLVFGFLRDRFGSLAAPACAHILHNSLTVALASAAPQLLPGLSPR